MEAPNRDFNKEKLRNRLNVHFQPIRQGHPSNKQINANILQVKKDLPRDRSQEFRNNQSKKSVFESARTKSISNLKLPSLERLPAPIPTDDPLQRKLPANSTE